MRNTRDRAADRAAASPETHGMAQFALQSTVRRLATGEHRLTATEIAADFDPRGGVR